MPISTALVAIAKSLATASWIAPRSRAGTDVRHPAGPWPTDPFGGRLGRRRPAARAR